MTCSENEITFMHFQERKDTISTKNESTTLRESALIHTELQEKWTITQAIYS